MISLFALNFKEKRRHSHMDKIELPILTVSQLTQAIKEQLETTFPSIWLQGEASNCKLHTSGHFYFSLKDAQAQIGAVMFRGNASKHHLPKDGDQIIVYGGLNVYPPSGKYQIIVQKLRHVGLGELLLKLEDLKKKLHKKGWFSKAHKKQIPKCPKKIGVVTSPTGAAIQDILNILTRRYAGFHVIINPVRVQGAGAAEEISEAIQQFNAYQLVDVMIVGRGGGSLEDLWPFNEEVVAEAIYHSQIPIIAAVGHETDHCIAEYVADVRAPTPSAAAELVITEKTQQLHQLSQIQKTIRQTLRHLLRQNWQRLQGIMRQPVIRSPYPILGTRMQQLDVIKQTLTQQVLHHVQKKRLLLEAKRHLAASLQPIRQIRYFRQKFHQLSQQLNHACIHQLARRKERLQHLASSLDAIDPKNLLARGYSILFSEKDNSVIKSVNNIKESQLFRALLFDGAFLATVNKIDDSRESTTKQSERTTNF